jgi:hypothetical protein
MLCTQSWSQDSKPPANSASSLREQIQKECLRQTVELDAAKAEILVLKEQKADAALIRQAQNAVISLQEKYIAKADADLATHEKKDGTNEQIIEELKTQKQTLTDDRARVIRERDAANARVVKVGIAALVFGVILGALGAVAALGN